MRILLIGFLLFVNTSVLADSVYKCKQDGSFIFSQFPCDDSEEKINISEAQSYSSSNSSKYASTNKSNQVDTTSYILNQKKKLIQSKISSLHSKKKKHIAKYKKDQIKLGKDKSDIYYERSVYQKMQTEIDRINKYIEQEKHKLRAVERKINQLN